MMEGRGEIVSLADPVPHAHLVLANPGVHSSTPEVFAAFRASTYPRPLNDLQGPAIRLHPEIGRLLAELESLGARDVMMSGSGATVFGRTVDGAQAERLARTLQSRGMLAWTAEFLI